MPLHTSNDLKELFQLLFYAPTEDDLDNVIHKYPEIFDRKNWVPLGHNESNYVLLCFVERKDTN